MVFLAPNANKANRYFPCFALQTKNRKKYYKKITSEVMDFVEVRRSSMQIEANLGGKRKMNKKAFLLIAILGLLILPACAPVSIANAADPNLVDWDDLVPSPSTGWRVNVPRRIGVTVLTLTTVTMLTLLILLCSHNIG